MFRKHDILRSPIYDLREMSDTQGKLFKTDTSLLAREASRPFPEIVGRNLVGSRVSTARLLHSRPSAVLVAHSSHADSLLGELRHAANGIRGLQVLNLHLTVSLLKYMATSLLVRQSLLARHSLNAASANPDLTVLAHTPTRPLSSLGAHNRYGSYVFLVDRHGRARWRTAGAARPEELDLFRQCALQLLSE